MAEMDSETLVPGHGNVLKGKDFVRQEIELLEAVIAAMAQEIGRTSASPQNRFEAIKKGVEQNVDAKAWRQKFAGDDPQKSRIFRRLFMALVCWRRHMLRCGRDKNSGAGGLPADSLSHAQLLTRILLFAIKSPTV